MTIVLFNCIIVSGVGDAFKVWVPMLHWNIVVHPTYSNHDQLITYMQLEYNVYFIDMIVIVYAKFIIQDCLGPKWVPQVEHLYISGVSFHRL